MITDNSSYDLPTLHCATNYTYALSNKWCNAGNACIQVVYKLQ